MKEIGFQILLLCLLCFFSGIRGYYTVKARRKDPSFIRKRIAAENKYNSKKERILQDLVAIMWGIPMLLFIFVPSFRQWAHLPFPDWIRWCGVGISIGSLFFLVMSHQALGDFWTMKLEVKPDHQLITGGLYAYIRHPMYTASICFMLSTALIAADWVLMCATIFALIEIYRRIRTEESMMVEAFGERYRIYIQRTGKLFPKIFRKRMVLY